MRLRGISYPCPCLPWVLDPQAHRANGHLDVPLARPTQWILNCIHHLCSYHQHNLLCHVLDSVSVERLGHQLWLLSFRQLPVIPTSLCRLPALPPPQWPLLRAFSEFLAQTVAMAPRVTQWSILHPVTKGIFQDHSPDRVTSCLEGGTPIPPSLSQPSGVIWHQSILTAFRSCPGVQLAVLHGPAALRGLHLCKEVTLTKSGFSMDLCLCSGGLLLSLVFLLLAYHPQLSQLHSTFISTIKTFQILKPPPPSNSAFPSFCVCVYMYVYVCMCLSVYVLYTHTYICMSFSMWLIIY